MSVTAMVGGSGSRDVVVVLAEPKVCFACGTTAAAAPCFNAHGAPVVVVVMVRGVSLALILTTPPNQPYGRAAVAYGGGKTRPGG
jgi:hypothetical protein